MIRADFDVARLGAGELEGAIPELVRILIDCVALGAGVSFLDPLSPEKADGFWRGKVLPAVAKDETALIAARRGGRVVGTVQVLLAMVENQPHRAEIAKLLVAPAARRQGVGRAAMEKAHEVAKEAGKSLLVLDTETGGLAEQLYLSLGYQEVGVIPGYALTPHGELCATTVLYKAL
jgi:ribosomal protein S18 acetylase RimI-like enzyme